MNLPESAFRIFEIREPANCFSDFSDSLLHHSLASTTQIVQPHIHSTTSNHLGKSVDLNKILHSLCPFFQSATEFCFVDHKRKSRVNLIPLHHWSINPFLHFYVHLTMSENGSQRTKPNVLITGTPGVGKTTTASMIAVRDYFKNVEFHSAKTADPHFCSQISLPLSFMSGKSRFATCHCWRTHQRSQVL